MRTTVPLRKARMREKQQERGHEVECRKLNAERKEQRCRVIVIGRLEAVTADIESEREQCQQRSKREGKYV